MKVLLIRAVFCALLLSISGCATCPLCGQPRRPRDAEPSESATASLVDYTLRGTVMYLQRVAMHPSADVELRLWDFSVPGEEPELVAERTLERPGQVPVKFTWPLESVPLDGEHEYGITARILVDGSALFVTDTHYRVLTLGHPSTVQLMLSRPPTTETRNP